jgi:diadenosine tetraphosphate (Ap4A) HIT family hydrolase
MDYEKLKVKDYRFWSLDIQPHQYPYLGRCVAWCKRQEAQAVSDMTKDERDELFNVIIPEWEAATQNLFHPDLYNYAMFANAARHLHWHLIPRYKDERDFGGITFVDKNWGHNYKPHENAEIPKKVIDSIKEAIAGSIISIN